MKRTDPAARLAFAALLSLVTAACGGSEPTPSAPGGSRSSAGAAGGQDAPAARSGSPKAVALESLTPSSPAEQAVALMAKVGASWSPSFSPDGRHIAFVSDMSGIPQVWTVEAKGGFPRLVTALEDPVGDVAWSPDGAWLAFSVAPGGGLNEQVHVVRPDGTGLRRLTAGGKDNNFLGDWTPDGKHLFLSSNRRDPATTDSYLVDVTSGELRQVAENHGTGGITDVSHDGSHAVLDRLKSRGSNDLFLLDLERSAEVILTQHEGPGTFLDGQFSPDGRTIYLGSNKNRDRIAFARIKIDRAGRPGPIEVIAKREDAELQSFRVNRQGTTAVLFWNVGGKTELSVVDLGSSRVRRGPTPPVENIFSPRFSRDGKRLCMVGWGAAAPVDVWLLDLATRRFTQVTRSPHAGIDLAALARPELVRYRAQDGLELSGWLYRPRDSKGPLPMVLSFHGGPEGQARPGFNSTFQALVGRGIAVFAPNVRGSAGFGKTFVNLDNGALRVGAVKDIKATVDHMVQAGLADPKRIGIMGGSYGGFMTMAGLTDYPDLFAAGADLYGVVNFETFFKNTQPWMAAISTVEYGDPVREAELLRRLSPIGRIDRVRAPTLVVHGANDTNVPLVEAEQVVRSLRARKVPVEYVLFPDEGHGASKVVNQIREAVAIVRWFDRHLQAR
jgi:dipeptidyl aminopeptidase/acylaminoacyl peptidase